MKAAELHPVAFIFIMKKKSIHHRLNRMVGIGTSQASFLAEVVP
jgi:hypothetical protein